MRLIHLLSLLALLFASGALAQTLPTAIVRIDGFQMMEAVGIGGNYPLQVDGVGALYVHCTTCGGSGGSGGAVTQSTGSSATPWWFEGLGTAGTAAGGVLTVQGVSGGTPQPVTGAFFQATQPVSIATMPTTPVTGAFYQATQPVSIATMPTTPVTGTFYQATQPVSGTVTTVPRTATISTPGCTVGTTSAQCLAAGAATNSLFLENTSATASIACSEGGTAVLNSSTSLQLAPGASMLYPINAIPTAALNCLASAASSPLYVRYN